MAANTTAILMDTAVSLAKLDVVARNVNDPHLAECVNRLSVLMQAMLGLLSELPQATVDDSRSAQNLSPERPLSAPFSD